MYFSRLTAAVTAAVVLVCSAHDPYAKYYFPYSNPFQSLPGPVSRAAAKPTHKWATVSHSAAAPEYTEWSFANSVPASGLTWGVECKSAACGAGMEDCVPETCEDRSAFTVKTAGDPPLLEDVGYGTEWTTLGKESKIFCEKYMFVNKVECEDALCNVVRLQCSPLMAQYRPLYGPRELSWYDGKKRTYCKDGQYMDGIVCLGDCHKFHLMCTEVQEYSKI